MNESPLDKSAIQILVVDDEQLQRVFLSKTLEKIGFMGLHLASSGEEGVEMCRNHAMDLVIVDLHMAGLDGFGLLEALQDGTITPTPAIMVVTNSESRDEMLRALNLGAGDFLRKPVRPDELELRVERLLLRRRKAKNTIREQVEEARILILEDQHIQRQVMTTYIGKQGFTNVQATGEAESLMSMMENTDTAPELIVMDLHLPDGSGLEMVRRLRERSDSRSPLILMITADKDFSLRQKAQASGVDDFLFKPLDRDELVARIRNLLGG